MLKKLATRSGRALHRRVFPRVPALAAVATPIRALSSAARGGGPDGFYVSKKVVKLTLVLGAVVTGGYLYLEREDADRKEIRLLLEQSQQSLENGDMKQSLKELEKAYDLHKMNFSDEKGMIAMAMAIGAAYEKMDDFDEAMMYYREALEFVSLEESVIQREDLRVLVLDRLGQCSKQSDDNEAAEKYFKQAIETYDQLKGKLSLSHESDHETSILSKLEEDILNVFLHYAVLLSMQHRPDDAARARQRLTTIARGSPQLRNQVAKINQQVDDYIALEKIRQERTLTRSNEDEDSSFE
ncbi:hypothetical protein PHMEG_00015141 [Phytophthora megakarya]|uniref:Uncharacterized protein n=1 Tax=Phytophthora megakarya TaxID=4795 RepID=A0A225W2M6_9STRA|nr:hypothetical protein PHMEG_00015141 [Phytophthora megakarya]